MVPKFVSGANDCFKDLFFALLMVFQSYGCRQQRSSLRTPQSELVMVRDAMQEAPLASSISLDHASTIFNRLNSKRGTAATSFREASGQEVSKEGWLWKKTFAGEPRQNPIKPNCKELA